MSATLPVSFSKALRHSNWDALLIILSLAHGVVLLAAPSVPVVAVGLWWNANTISHNFVHLPFFRSGYLNRIYSLYLSLVLGFPQTVWRDRHLAHHAGMAYRMRLTAPVLAEIVLLIALWGSLLTYVPAFFWTVYLPGYLAGMGLCYLHGYFEHACGTVSHYGVLYNVSFFNDGYHVEHHRRPTEHWTRLPEHASANTRTSRWPAVLRWIEVVNLELLENIALRSVALQRILLRTHERALRKLLPELADVRTVKIVGGGMFPRTAILLRKLLPEAQITIADADEKNLATCRRFLADGAGHVSLAHEMFEAGAADDADLVVIPLSFIGNRGAIYDHPPARAVLVHDWIWSRRAESVVVSPWLLKRMNLIRQ